MDKQFSTIGYGFLLEETLMLLDAALESNDAHAVRGSCIQRWPQKSESNKEKLWQHMKYRFLEIENNSIKNTSFLKMFRKIRSNDEAVQDLVFFQLCITTPILSETLSLLVTDSFLNTGEAVLGYALYHDASKNGWRAPSTATVINEGTIAPIFMAWLSAILTEPTLRKQFLDTKPEWGMDALAPLKFLTINFTAIEVPDETLEQAFWNSVTDHLRHLSPPAPGGRPVRG